MDTHFGKQIHNFGGVDFSLGQLNFNVVYGPEHVDGCI